MGLSDYYRATPYNSYSAGIVFNTQESCGQGVVEGCFVPLVTGYRFRYLGRPRGFIVCKHSLDCRVSFSIPR